MNETEIGNIPLRLEEEEEDASPQRQQFAYSIGVKSPFDLSFVPYLHKGQNET